MRDTLSEKLCYVQAEPHLKSGTKTVGELGPEKLGNLNPGQETTSSLPIAGEPKLAGVSYDGYVVHMEVFDCSGSDPAAHTAGEGGENMAPEVKVVMNLPEPGPKKATTQMPLPRMRPMMQSAAAPG